MSNLKTLQISHTSKMPHFGTKMPLHHVLDIQDFAEETKEFWVCKMEPLGPSVGTSGQ